ncbi:hypothetical protein RCL_jg21171.t1 [Rhizophagus clarus]|uniref:Uncharacterized protein n=1 Tax=Rhizophagus clarus TaxID=94130 RepID=A0A8H3LY54_9GLOM|nr:hypothetical protein RCL_jg21171.t1 [Rhizophagus clarus]
MDTSNPQILSENPQGNIDIHENEDAIMEFKVEQIKRHGYCCIRRRPIEADRVYFELRKDNELLVGNLEDLS